MIGAARAGFLGAAGTSTGAAGTNVVALVDYEGDRTVLASAGETAATYTSGTGTLSTAQAERGSYSLVSTYAEYMTLDTALGTTGCIEGFFRSLGQAAKYRMFAVGGHQETNQFQCWLDAADAIGLRQGGANAFSAASGFSDNTWYHVAYSWTGGTGQFYANGSRIASFSQSGTYSSPIVSVGNTYDLGYAFNGYIDCFRVSKVSRYTGSSITVPNPNSWFG